MRLKLHTVAMVAAIAAATPASAAIVTYTGADNSVSSLAQMTNSTAAAANFAAVTPGATTINFETPVPSSISISGGNVTSNSGCGSLCGFNTSAAGSNFVSIFAVPTTITFDSPVNAFGFFLTGLQADLVGAQTVTFSDGSSQSFNIPRANNGGGAFFGLTDFTRTITSFTFDPSNDIVALDDLRFGNFGEPSGVPEPATWAMMLLGFGGIGFALRRSRRSAALMQTA